MSMIVPPGRLDEHAELLRRVLEGEHIEQFVTERLRRDGTPGAGLADGVARCATSTAAIVGASTIARDVTAQRAAEADRSQLEALVACSADAIISTDVGFRITSCNAAAAELYRIPRDEMLGRVATEISESAVGPRRPHGAHAPRARGRDRLDRGRPPAPRRQRVRARGDRSAGAHARRARSSGSSRSCATSPREWQARATLERDGRRARMLAEASSVLERSLQAAHVARVDHAARRARSSQTCARS